MANNEDSIDIAKSELKKAIPIIIISIATYIMPMLTGFYDSGIIIESISLILIMLSITALKKSKIEMSKILNIIAIVIILLLMVYDVNLFLNNIETNYDRFKMPFYYIAGEFILIVYLKKVFKANKILNNIGTEEEKETTDWFFYRNENDKK